MKRILLAAMLVIALVAPAWAEPSVRVTHPEGPVEDFRITPNLTIEVRPGDVVELFEIYQETVDISVIEDNVILFFGDEQHLTLAGILTAFDGGATLIFADAIPALSSPPPDAPPVMPINVPDPIIGKRYGFFDKGGGEERGLGLYSYAILTSRFAVERNVAFLSVLFQSTALLSGDLPNLATLNVIHIPTADARTAWVYIKLPISQRTRASLLMSAARRSAGVILDKHYDFDLALDTLDRFCTARFESCADADAAGPYLIVLNEPIDRSGAARYLFLDLTAVHPKAFGEFLSAFKEQVKSEDFSDRQKIDALRLVLLNLTLDAADWVNPISEGVAGIMELVWPDD